MELGPSLQGTREVINESFNIASLIANEGAPKSIQQVSIAHSWVVPPSINIVTETKIVWRCLPPYETEVLLTQ